MKQITWFALLLAIAAPSASAQAPPAAERRGNPSSEREAYAKAVQPRDPAEKAASLEAFLKEHPSSRMAGSAHMQLFETYLSLRNKGPEYVEKAFASADRAIAAATRRTKPNSYSSVARALAEADFELEKAAAYVEAGIEFAKKISSSKRTHSMLLDTRAEVELRRGRPDAAEKDAREAVATVGSGADDIEESAEYVARLGILLAKTGRNPDEAANLLATALLVRDVKGASDALDKLIEKQGAADPKAARTQLFKKAGEAHVAAAVDKAAARSRIATSYSRLAILPEEAMSLARASVESLTSTSPGDTIFQSYRTYGTALAAAGQHEEAVAAFRKVGQLASQYDVDFHLRLGRSLEALGREKEALDTYMNGAALSQPPRLMAVLTPLYTKLNGSEDGLKDRLKKISEEVAAFDPEGAPKTSPNGRVVLAELFTGSECGPCLSADKAFDFLMKAYDRRSVAVLEYHLHIPGPDPMTNPDTEARSKYYDVRGTPTAVVGGTDSRLGGGTLAAARSSYNAYAFAIDRRITAAPSAEVTLDGTVDGSIVKVNAAASAAASGGRLRLRIALVEESVKYKGSNGWEEHRAVVRKMIGGAEGLEFDSGKASYAGTIDVAAVSRDLRNYIEEVEKEPRQLSFKEKRSEVDAGNLALVAFVQDDESREVLQASYLPLDSAGVRR